MILVIEALTQAIDERWMQSQNNEERRWERTLESALPGEERLAEVLVQNHHSHPRVTGSSDPTKESFMSALS